MSAELLATLCLFAFLIGITVLAFVVGRREVFKLYGTIDALKAEIEAKVHENLQNAIDTFAESFQEILGQPTIKKAFSLIGSQGGEAKATSGLVDQMANDVLSSGQFQGIIAGAQMMGLNVEEYIEEHGAVKTIQAAQQLAKMLGIDIMKMDLSNIGSLAKPAQSSDNPYFRR
jgi:tRNA threonylcarbamoyladenosine modification (KEOPS) complex Cgi121 subunit